MEPRNKIGLVLILMGVVLQPIGWMFFYWFHIISFGLIAVGALLFFTNRYLDKSVEKEFIDKNRSGSAVPGDIHDHSGWGKGGRSDSWSSSLNDGGDGGGGD